MERLLQITPWGDYFKCLLKIDGITMIPKAVQYGVLTEVGLDVVMLAFFLSFNKENIKSM